MSTPEQRVRAAIDYLRRERVAVRDLDAIHLALDVALAAAVARGRVAGLTEAAEIADRVASSPWGAGYPGAVSGGSPAVLGDRIYGARSVEAAVLHAAIAAATPTVAVALNALRGKTP